MKQYWKKLADKIDGMSLRERALIFAAVAFMLVSLIMTTFLDPLLAQQKKLSAEVVQKQERMKGILAEIETLLAAKRADAISPMRQHLEQVRRQIAEGDIYLQSRRERLVAPENMGGLLEEVLRRNGRLQLISLQTLPAAPLIEKVAKPGKEKERAVPADAAVVPDKQVFRHGVRITVRGSYPDLLQYLTALEQLPAQMFWGEVDMEAAYPDVTLTLTLYTLSLDKIWLQI
ncbi:hypothetical protein PLCT2_02787 [Planctomycetaceae bacterium]|nr:hypothetical protein PLCT2_02787 [Planctomycetaceae bacterium]